MQLTYYYKRELLNHVFEIFNVVHHLPVSYSCVGRQVDALYNTIVVLHGNNSLGIGETVLQKESDVEKLTYFTKNMLDSLTLDYLNSDELIDPEETQFSTAFNVALETFRENKIITKKHSKVMFDFPYYINSDQCILKLYHYLPALIKVNIGGDYKKDIEAVKRVQQVLSVFKIDAKLRIYGNGRYTQHEASQIINNLKPELCEYLMQLLPDLKMTEHKELKKIYKDFEFGLENTSVLTQLTNGIEDWPLKVTLQDCGSLRELERVIKHSNIPVIFGSEISGYLNNLIELSVYPKLKENINPYLETTGFIFLDENISGIHYVNKLRCNVDLNKAFNSFLLILKDFRQKNNLAKR